MKPDDFAWPPDGPTDRWTCSLNLDCDEGWFETRPTSPGQAPTARRCPCLVRNIRLRKTQRADSGASVRVRKKDEGW